MTSLRWFVLNDNGDPVEADIFTAARFLRENHLVGNDTIGRFEVSTVFLGLDHSHGRGEPVVFETMIFSDTHPYCWGRYRTRAEAVAGHQQCVADVKRARGDK